MPDFLSAATSLPLVHHETELSGDASCRCPNLTRVHVILHQLPEVLSSGVDNAGEDDNGMVSAMKWWWGSMKVKWLATGTEERKVYQITNPTV